MDQRVSAALNKHCLAGCIAPCSFSRCLATRGIPRSAETLLRAGTGKHVQDCYTRCLRCKNFPRTVRCATGHRCVSDICRGVLLNSVVAQGNVQGSCTVGVLVGGLTRSIGDRVSCAGLRNVLGSVNVSIKGRDVVSCVRSTGSTCLVFDIRGCCTEFTRGRDGPGCCFDSGNLLGLFLSSGGPSLLRGTITIYLARGRPRSMFCLGSPGAKVSVSFCVPSTERIIRITCSVRKSTCRHRIKGLGGFTTAAARARHCIVIACRRRGVVGSSSIGVRIIPLVGFLLGY